MGKHLKAVISISWVHVAGHGGAKKTVRNVFHALSPGNHVVKSDVATGPVLMKYLFVTDICHFSG